MKMLQLKKNLDIKMFLIYTNIIKEFKRVKKLRCGG